MRTTKPEGLICFRRDGVFLKPGTWGKPGYRGIDPEAPWRRLYEDGQDIVRRWANYEIDAEQLLTELYAPAGLAPLTWSVRDVQAVFDNPQLISPAEARETLDAFLDGRYRFADAAAELLAEALYQLLRARRQLEGSSRLKALQRLEGCKTCKSIDFAVRSDGTRVCGCGQEWAFGVEIRTRTVKAQWSLEVRGLKVKARRDTGVKVTERTLVPQGRTLVTVEV